MRAATLTKKQQGKGVPRGFSVLFDGCGCNDIRWGNKLSDQKLWVLHSSNVVCGVTGPFGRNESENRIGRQKASAGSAAGLPLLGQVLYH